jgi:hypothetical protein
MDDIKKGYTRTPMYDDDPMEAYDEVSWPPEDMSENASNHRRRVSRNKRNENTR